LPSQAQPLALAQSASDSYAWQAPSIAATCSTSTASASSVKLLDSAGSWDMTYEGDASHTTSFRHAHLATVTGAAAARGGARHASSTRAAAAAAAALSGAMVPGYGGWGRQRRVSGSDGALCRRSMMAGTRVGLAFTSNTAKRGRQQRQRQRTVYP
jgi:hypothetical protein